MTAVVTNKLSLWLVVLSFLCGLEASNLHDRSFENQTPYPPEWGEAPSKLGDFPVREIQGRTYTTIDPWDYRQRLGIFKVLVITSRRYFADWGYNNTGNLLWGLPLQYGWQWTSGRLRDMTSRGSCGGPLCVSPTSWWADMNYYLSVIPFLGALNAGVFKSKEHPIYIRKPANSSARVRHKFCVGIRECSSRHPGLIEKWTVFFEIVRSMDLPRDDAQRNVTVARLWDAHTTSLHNASPLFEEELNLLSVPEMHFGRGWAQLVEFIAAALFQTNFNNTLTQQEVALPPRLLHQGDRPPFISDLSKFQNRALEIINVLYDVNRLTRGLFLGFWERAMCSEKGRADGRYLMEHLIENPWIAPREVIKLMCDFVEDHKC